jgi:hypothetical protein
MCTCAIRFRKKKSGLPQEFAICDLKCNIEKRVNFRAYLAREEKKSLCLHFSYEIELIPMKFLHDFCEIHVFLTGPYSRTTSLYNQDPHYIVWSPILQMCYL